MSPKLFSLYIRITTEEKICDVSISNCALPETSGLTVTGYCKDSLRYENLDFGTMSPIEGENEAFSKFAIYLRERKKAAEVPVSDGNVLYLYPDSKKNDHLRCSWVRSVAPVVENNDRSKQARVDDSSCAPPVSGSMVDALKIEQRWGRSKLPEPVIIASLPHSTESMWTRKDIQVNDTLSRIYAEGSVTDASGHVHKFKDTTNPVQGRHLYNLVKENRYTRTMEIGLAMGASAAWICQAHHELHMGGRHLAIDPNQTSQYASIGLHLSQLCGVREHLSLLEMPSYRGLPRLLEQVLAGEQAPFHLIYIDGWHTFDYTLVDFFYADLLLQVNGIIVLDDVRHKPVRSCLNYLATNYSHYELVNETPCYNSSNERISTQATFIKRSPDHRTWNHHARFEG